MLMEFGASELISVLWIDDSKVDMNLACSWVIRYRKPLSYGFYSTMIQASIQALEAITQYENYHMKNSFTSHNKNGAGI